MVQTLKKVQQLMFKDVLGVQKKGSNLATIYELGTFPIWDKTLLSTFIYYKRLNCYDDENMVFLKIPILMAAKLEDDNFYNTGI